MIIQNIYDYKRKFIQADSPNILKLGFLEKVQKEVESQMDHIKS